MAKSKSEKSRNLFIALLSAIWAVPVGIVKGIGRGIRGIARGIAYVTTGFFRGIYNGIKGFFNLFRDKYTTEKFLSACERGNIELVRKHFDLERNIDSIKQGIELAAGKGHIELTKLLFDEGSDYDYNLKELLYAASKGGDINLLNSLLDKDVIKDQISYFGTQLLHDMVFDDTISKPNMEVVERVLEFPELQDETISFNFPLFKQAVSKNYVDMVSTLLKCFNIGNNFFSEEQYLLELINIAKEQDFSDMEKLLTERLEDYRIRTSHYIPGDILEKAAEDGNLEVVKKYRDTGEKIVFTGHLITSIEKALYNGHIGVAKYMLEFDDIKNSLNSYGVQLIRKAAEYGQKDIVEDLLTYNAVRENNSALIGAFHAAAMNGHRDIAELMIEYDYVAQRCYDVFHELIDANQIDVIDVIIKSGNLSDHEIIESFKRAARNGQLEAVNYFFELDLIRTAENIQLIENYNLIPEIRTRCDEVMAEIRVLEEKISRFHQACLDGDINAVNELLQDEDILKKVDVDNNKAINNAARNGHLDVVNRLLEIEAVQKKISDSRYQVVLLAMSSGRLDLVNRFLEIEEVQQHIAPPDQYYLFLAMYLKNLELMNRLLQFETVRNVMIANANKAICAAIELGNLEILNRILEFEDVRSAISDNGNRAFILAAAFGNLGIVNRLLEFDEVRSQITVDGNIAFARAVQFGHLDVVDQLLEFDEVRSDIAANDNRAFDFAARFGHLDTVVRLLEFEKVRSKIDINENQTFRWAAREGHIDVVNCLLDYDEVLSNITAKDNQAFRWAVEFNRVDVVNRLLEFDEVRSQVAARNNEAFISAATNGNLELVNSLLEFEEVRSQISVNSNEAFRYAASNGHANIVNRLLEFEEVEREVTAHDNEAIVRATINGHLAVVQRIYQYPGVQEALLVRDWVHGTPADRALRSGHRDVFEFLVRNMPTLESHHTVAGMAANPEGAMLELSGAQSALLQKTKEYYQEEYISSGEVDAITNNIRAYLEEAYAKSPVYRRVEGYESSNLPLTLTSAEIASLEDESHKKAYEPLPIVLNTDEMAALEPAVKEAFYKNPFHTAWRYLQSPNPWMSPAASFVNDLPDGGRCAAMNYKDRELMAFCWLAASDQSIQTFSGITPYKMKELFIEELALIARAHNWDRSEKDVARSKGFSWVAQKNSPMVDDLEGDKPSCSMGVTQRLATFLQWHPLSQDKSTRELNPEIVIERFLSAIVFDAFKEYLKNLDLKACDELSDVLDRRFIIMSDLSEDERKVINGFQISDEQVEIFIEDFNAWFGEDRMDEGCVFQLEYFQNYKELIAKLRNDPWNYCYQPMSILFEAHKQILSQELSERKLKHEILPDLVDEVLPASSSVLLFQDEPELDIEKAATGSEQKEPIRKQTP